MTEAAADEEAAYPSLDTPAVLLALDKLEANIAEMSRLASEAGVKLRPHIKIHESAFIARMQLAAGACGIEVGPLDQAEAFVEEGFDDILVAHPFYGRRKLEKLKKLLDRTEVRIAVVVDMLEQAEGISLVGQAAGRRVPVYLKVETGGGRYGVLPGEPALKLARRLTALSGIELAGVYTHETNEGPTAESAERVALEVASTASDVATALRREGVNVGEVTVGASPTFRSTCRLKKEGRLPEITEVHPGSSVVGDMRYISRGALTEDRCPISVLVGVMSTSQPSHAVVDAGLKTFGGDIIVARLNAPDFLRQGMPSFGRVRGRPDLYLGSLSNEVGCLYYTDPGKKVRLGERFEVIPNNAMVVINAHDRLYGVRNGRVEQVIPVTGRGRGS